MSEHQIFAADWLSLREPADHAARSEALFARLTPFLTERAAQGGAVRILDLGAGSGSNLRWLAPRLEYAQDWTLVDRDAGLLARAEASSLQAPTARPLRVQTLKADLADSALPWIAAADLVTAAAFFDLVSAEWIERLSASCARVGAACLFVLSVDGRRGLMDANGSAIKDEDDLFLQALFNAHQRREKGLGAALGPDAGPALARRLAAHGLEVETQASDWRLPAGQDLTKALGRELIKGWRAAALEQAPDAASRIDAWHQRRQAELAAGRLGLHVGHLDVLALPPRR
ncbi:MAG: methyltransferase domain-containing protein [Wenzhouxiangella sp.]